MVYGLLVLLTHETSICKSHSTAFKLIQSEHFTPSSFPCKDSCFWRNDWIPNQTIGEIKGRGKIETFIHDKKQSYFFSLRLLSSTLFGKDCCHQVEGNSFIWYIVPLEPCCMTLPDKSNYSTSTTLWIEP